MKSSCKVIYVGGPTVILEIGGLRIMTDPTLDPSGAAFPDKEKPAYWKTEGPAVQQTGKIDMVLLSHDQHGDNLDAAGRELLKTTPLVLTTKVGAGRLKGNAQGLSPWESMVVDLPDGDQLTITGTPARHGPAGIEKIAGDVTGFVLTVKGKQEMELYITGDTVFYEGIQEVAAKFKPQYVFIFAGAAQPRGPFNLTMGANDALDTAFAFPQATIIPVHFEGWSHYTENGAVLQQSFTALGIPGRLKLLKPGVITELNN